MRSVGEMYRGTRELAKDPFDPRVAAEMTDHEIRDMLEPYPQLQMRHFTVPAFRENATYIRDRFGGDISELYADTTDYKTIVSRAKNTDRVIEGSKGLQGFRHKMVSMLLYYLADTDSIDQPSEKIMLYFNFPLPVDIHIACFSAGTNCVKMQGYQRDENIMTESLQQLLRDMYYDYSLTHGTDQLTVANVVWLLGSWFCSYSPETFSSIRRLDGRNSHIEPYQPNYSVNTRDFSA